MTDLSFTMPPAWTVDALCAQVDPELFFATDDGVYKNLHAAMSVCKSCPVASECLDDALSNSEPHGIRGGITPRKRLAMRMGRWAA
jgi:WhiB family redox-sensing transcriptional regulator